jgi:alanine dehydrogenase
MRIGVPKEIKANENRVGLVPACVRELRARGHEVAVETGAGLGAGLGDEQYAAAGAKILPDAAAVFARADMIGKVKEPQRAECAMLRQGQVLFTYLHLAADPEQTAALCRSGCVAIAYETITDAHGRLPLLAPMSEVAGRMAVQAGARWLEQSMRGAGVLLSGVPGVEPAKIVILAPESAARTRSPWRLGLGPTSR